MKENHILPFLWMRGESPEILRDEIQKIYDAGIRSLCLEARPHPDYAGNDWWRDVDIVIAETQKKNMQIWILDDAHFPTGMANYGMTRNPDKARRFLYTQFVDVAGPVPAAQVDVNLLMTKHITWMDLAKPQTKPLYDETMLLSVTAAKIYENDTIDGEIVDLTKQVKDGYLTADIPEGVWRIYVTFSTTDIGPRPDYINYVEKDSVRVLIDEVYEKHYEKYKDLFGTTIAGFFSDEPGFYNNDTYDESNYIGLKMTLPWGKEMNACMKAAYGESLYRDLPYLFAAEKDGKERELRNTYMETVSTLYSKNFSQQLGDWCRTHGVQYIGHIVEDSCGHMRLGAGCGHYFRAMAGQDIAGIDNIGYQIMPGNDVASRHTGFQDLKPEFYHYQLGKLGSSAAAIDPMKKGRTLCENFGAYGWRLGVRDMKWLVDFLVGQGVNYFVPHAFSMAEYPDNDCPPHFYARGKNPQFSYFCELMGYTDRLCNLFSEGQNVPQVAVLYEAESDWAGQAMRGSAVGKELMTHQIDFEFVPSDVFADADYYGCEVKDGKLVINHRAMQALIVPECEYIPARAAIFIAQHPELPVIYLNHLPMGVVGTEEDMLTKAVAGRECVVLKELSETLIKKNIRDTVYPNNVVPNLQMYHYRKNGKELYHLMNTSLSEMVDVELHVSGENYGYYDALKDVTTEISTVNQTLHLILPPYGVAVLVENPETATSQEREMTLDETISLDKYVLDLKEIGREEVLHMDAFSLQPISSIYRDFSGIAKYHTEFKVNEIPAKAVFSAQYVYECMTVTVNGKTFPGVITPPYCVDITSALMKGVNNITVSVATTALRNANTKPGIFGKERTILEPTGMFGKTEIRLYR